MAEPVTSKVVDLFQHLHTPDFIKTLMGYEDNPTIRPSTPNILQVEMIDMESFECYHFPNRFEFKECRLLEHHLRYMEKIPEERIQLLLTVMTNYKVANYNRLTNTVHPVIKSSKHIDD